MTFNYWMPPQLRQYLNQRYNIVAHTEFKDFDYNFDQLRDFFTKTRKDSYSPDDRYIIEHHDTDIYIDTCKVGINLQNFFEIVREVDIPFYTLLFYTNHIGITKEIDILCQDRLAADRPTVLESFVTTLHISDRYDHVDVAPDQIKYHIMCLMGRNRSHRFALYNSIKHLPSEKAVITIQGKT